MMEAVPSESAEQIYEIESIEKAPPTPTPSASAQKAGNTVVRLETKDEIDLYQPWQERARCREFDPEIFFPEKGGSSREAKRICGECAVKLECLNYALKRDERYGVWGGMSERERRRLKRMAKAS